MVAFGALMAAACGGGSEPQFGGDPPSGFTPSTATAEATVRAWVDAYAATDADLLVALHIPEQRQIQRPGYESWAAEVQTALAQTGPDSVRSRFLRALFTAPAPEEVELEVLSESDREIVIDARANYGIAGRSIPVRWKFRLSKQDDHWLIHGLTGFVPDGLLVWVKIVVSDHQGNPVPGAQVTISTAGQQVTRPTDDSGLAVFPNVLGKLENNAISVVKEGFSTGISGSFFSGFNSVVLRPLVSVHKFSVKNRQDGGGIGVPLIHHESSLELFCLLLRPYY